MNPCRPPGCDLDTLSVHNHDDRDVGSVLRDCKVTELYPHPKATKKKYGFGGGPNTSDAGPGGVPEADYVNRNVR